MTWYTMPARTMAGTDIVRGAESVTCRQYVVTAGVMVAWGVLQLPRVIIKLIVLKAPARFSHCLLPLALLNNSPGWQFSKSSGLCDSGAAQFVTSPAVPSLSPALCVTLLAPSIARTRDGVKVEYTFR